MKVWIAGAVREGDEACVPVSDHGFLYGDGVFEGMRVYAGGVFRLEDHLARLRTGARYLGLALPGGTASLRRIVAETVDAFGREEAYVRLVVSRGDGPLGVDPTQCPEPRVVCIVDEVRLYPPEIVERGLALATASVRRPPPDVLDPRVKSLNYLGSALAKQEARRQGADEALLLGPSGRVAEASVANVFAVRGGALVTPPPTEGALEGITRATVLELAREEGIPAAERALGRVDLFAADEVFLTGSGARIVPVASLDGRPIGTGGAGPLTKRLLALFDARVRAEASPLSPAPAGR